MGRVEERKGVIMFKYLLIFIWLLLWSGNAFAHGTVFVSIYSWAPEDYKKTDRSDFIRLNYPKAHHYQHFMDYEANQTDFLLEKKVESIWKKVLKEKPDYILIYNSRAFMEFYVKKMIPAKMTNGIFYSVPRFIVDQYKNEIGSFPIRGSIITTNVVKLYDRIKELGFSTNNIYIIRNPSNIRDLGAKKEIFAAAATYNIKDYTAKNTTELINMLIQINKEVPGFLLMLTTDLLDVDTGRRVTYPKLTSLIINRNKKHFETILYRNLSEFGFASSITLSMPTEMMVSPLHDTNKLLLELVQGAKPRTYEFYHELIINKDRCDNLGFGYLINADLPLKDIYE